MRQQLTDSWFRRVIVMITVFTVTCAVGLPSILADEAAAETQENGLNTIAVGRVDRDAGTIAGPVTVITAEQIARMGAKTVVDVLRLQPGINVRSLSGTDRLAAVDIRGGGVGTSEEKAPGVMVLVDGRPITNPFGYSTPDASVNWPVIPVQNIERIEIYRGSNSVVWGTQAYLGTINIVTKAAPAEGHRLSLGTRVGSYDSFQQYVGVAGNVDGIDYSVNSGYDTTDGYQARNRFRTRYTNVRLSSSGNTCFNWDLQAGMSRDQYDFQYPIDDGMDRLEENGWSRHETRRQYISFIPRLALGPGELAIPVHYQERKIDDLGGGDTIDIIEYRFMPQYSVLVDIADMQHNLVFGVDFYVNQFDDDGGWGGEEYRRNVGWFIHDTVALVPDQLYLDLGFRRTRVHHDYSGYGGNWEGAYSVNSYEAGLTWVYAEGSRAFVRAARGFQDYGLYEWPEITDQRFREYQAGVAHRFSDCLTGGITIFRIEGQNEYYWDSLIADSVRNGVELEMVYQPSTFWRLAANYTWIDARWQDSDISPTSNNEIDGRPAHSGAVIFSVFPLENLSADLSAKVVRGNEAVYSNPAAFTSWEGRNYMVVDAAVSYVWNGFTFYAGVNNIFGEEYSEVGMHNSPSATVYPMPERNFFAGVNYVKDF
jgi:iron complex outermembrane receptor protein